MQRSHLATWSSDLADSLALDKRATTQDSLLSDVAAAVAPIRTLLYVSRPRTIPVHCSA
jgi:hypothetical protein